MTATRWEYAGSIEVTKRGEGASFIRDFSFL